MIYHPELMGVAAGSQRKNLVLRTQALFERNEEINDFVLNYVPPRIYPGSSGDECEAAEFLQTYRLNYFTSGHSLQFRYFAGSSWAPRGEGT